MWAPSRAYSSGVSDTSTAPSRSSSCSNVRGPTIGAVTPAVPSSQASATCGIVAPRSPAIARERGATISQVAIAWLLGEPGVVAPIVGPRTFEQLEDLLGAADLRLSDEERERLAAHAPPPVMYPQRMLAEQMGLGELAQLRR